MPKADQLQDLQKHKADGTCLYNTPLRYSKIQPHKQPRLLSSFTGRDIERLQNRYHQLLYSCSIEFSSTQRRRVRPSAHDVVLR